MYWSENTETFVGACDYPCTCSQVTARVNGAAGAFKDPKSGLGKWPDPRRADACRAQLGHREHRRAKPAAPRCMSPARATGADLRGGGCSWLKHTCALCFGWGCWDTGLLAAPWASAPEFTWHVPGGKTRLDEVPRVGHGVSRPAATGARALCGLTVCGFVC